MSGGELKPCPFCGGDSAPMFGNIRDVWMTCLDCSAEGPYRDTEAEAIEAWNTRAAVNATADIPVEALEAGVIAQILEAAGLMWETLTYVSEASECQASREAAAETMRNVSPALALAKGEAA